MEKITRRSTYAPYDSDGIKMVDYENIVKALLKVKCPSASGPTTN